MPFIEKSEYLRKNVQGRKANRNLKLSLDSGEFDDDNLRLGLSYSSEQPYRRWFGVEILSHEKGCQDLSRMASGAFLWNHDRDRVIGVVEESRVDDKKKVGYAVVRFSKSEEGKRFYEEVKDGILTNVSFAYSVEEMKFTGEKDGIDQYLVTRYSTLEISLVSVPADFTVGVGRSITELENDYQTYLRSEGDEDMGRRSGEPIGGATGGAPISVTPTLAANPPAANPPAASATREGGASAEPAASADHVSMMKIATSYGMPDLGIQFVEEGRSLTDLQNSILEKIGGNQATPVERPTAETDAGLTQAEAQSYRFNNAIRSLTDPSFRSFESEVNEQVIAKYGTRNEGGIAIPPEVLRVARGLDSYVQRDTVSVNAGSGLIPQGNKIIENDIQLGSFAELLRSKMVILDAGVRILSDLEGNVTLVRQTVGATAQWTAEGIEPQGSAIDTEPVLMKPRRLATYIDLTRTFVRQVSIDAEQMTIDDLTSAVATGTQRAAFQGSGVGEEPRGLENYAEINNVDKPFAEITYSDITGMETFVEESDIDPDTAVYVSSPRVKGSLKAKPTFPNGSMPIWNGNEMNGRPAFSTSSVSPGRVVYGKMNELVIGEWGPLWLQLNPFIKSSSGILRIDIERLGDIAVRRLDAFQVLGRAVATTRSNVLKQNAKPKK